MSNLKLRRARACNIPAMTEIQRASMEEIAAADYKPSQIAAFLKQGEAVLSDLVANAHCWVMTDGALIVGCASWCWAGEIRLSALPPRPERTEAEVRSVHVRPGWTRRGVARRLLERIEREARQAGALRLSLLSTRGARDFYRALGFSIIAEKALEIDDISFPGIAMAKALAGARSAA